MTRRIIVGTLGIVISTWLFVAGNTFLYASALPTDDNDLSRNGAGASGQTVTHHISLSIGDVILPPPPLELPILLSGGIVYLTLLGAVVVAILQRIARGPPWGLERIAHTPPSLFIFT